MCQWKLLLQKVFISTNQQSVKSYKNSQCMIFLNSTSIDKKFINYSMKKNSFSNNPIWASFTHPIWNRKYSKTWHKLYLYTYISLIGGFFFTTQKSKVNEIRTWEKQEKIHFILWTLYYIVTEGGKILRVYSKCVGRGSEL